MLGSTAIAHVSEAVIVCLSGAVERGVNLAG